jgi:hypothetical protein
MSLRYILAEVAPEVGLKMDNDDERDYLINQVNKAWKELYESRDLIHCEREQLFSVDASLQQVSLPWYVGEIRGVRDHYNERRIDLVDMRPRYKSDGWAKGPLPHWWRDKGVSPQKREILNEGQLTLTIPEAEDSAFSVVVVGRNSNSARVTETVVFAIGDTEKTTSAIFNEVHAFLNINSHQFDVTMLDINDNEISVLPNIAERALYRTINILPQFATHVDPWMVEIMYKHSLMYLWDDYDELICPGYDDAVVWQTLGNIKAKTKPDQAELAFTKVREILYNRDINEGKGKLMDITFEENPMLFQTQSAYNSSGLYPGIMRK